MTLLASAAVLHETSGKMTIQPVEVGEPRADEVLVEIVASGICHTDVVVIHGALQVPLPVVLGHEGAGVVVSVGSAVSSVQPGDSVVLSYSSCGSCRSCASHEPAYCNEFMPRNFGAARSDGSSALSSEGTKVHSHFFGQSSFATHAVAPERNVVKVATDIPLDILAPLGCGIQTGAGSILNSLKVRAGSSVLVMGAGAVGISAVMASRIAGADKIVTLDLSETRLALAKELGATDILKADGRSVRELLKSINLDGVDYVLDTTGVPTLVNEAFAALNIRGVIGLSAGYPHEDSLSVNLSSTMLFGRSVKGIIEGDSVPQDFIPKLISYYRQGLFPFDRLIEAFEFSEINEAIDACASGRVIKPVLRMK